MSMAQTNPTENEPELRSLVDILDALGQVREHTGDSGGDSDEGSAEEGDEDGAVQVSVADVLSEIGTRSFAPIILVPALILVSPLSGIFGLPTIGATIIFLITVQKLLGRPHVWVPGIIRRRKVNADKLDKAIDWLRKPCAWVDRKTEKRLSALVSRPARTVNLLLICAICLVIPALEILPMVTSLFATAITFFAIALSACWAISGWAPAPA